METEGLFEYYSSQIKKAEKKDVAKLLARFYSELFGVTNSTQTIIMFNKLLKEFSRATILKALSAMFSTNKELDHTHIYGLIKYICINQIEKKEVTTVASLDDYVDSVREKLEKSKKRKVKVTDLD